MTDEKTIKVGLGLYILNDRGQVLLGLRKAKHGEGTWCPPGGHLEYGESFEEGAVREAFEETGIRVNPADVRGINADAGFFKGFANRAFFKTFAVFQMSSRRTPGAFAVFCLAQPEQNLSSVIENIQSQTDFYRFFVRHFFLLSAYFSFMVLFGNKKRAPC